MLRELFTAEGIRLTEDTWGDYFITSPRTIPVKLSNEQARQVERELLIGHDGYPACSRNMFLLVAGSYLPEGVDHVRQ